MYRNRWETSWIQGLTGLAGASILALASPSPARACGCLSPPLPEPAEDYAVNQQSEQIIFEVGEGEITVHVLIRYEGDPAQFAWLIPVPNAHDIALSSTSMFGILDYWTQPELQMAQDNICPAPRYRCTYHPQQSCPGDDVDGSMSPRLDVGAGNDDSDIDNDPDAVEVESRVRVGDYEVVVISADDADAATNWLQGEGFIVNSSMAPFMQPYLDANMMFLAAKLIPGADADAIRPLKFSYDGENPMIPLRLTAVAAEPELSVVTYVFGPETYAPGQSVISWAGDQFSYDGAERVNYPMAVSRAIDEVGGEAFVYEYGDYSERLFDEGTSCCGEQGWDRCGLGDNGVCECPGVEFDDRDCENPDEVDAPDNFVAGATQLREVLAHHPILTRFITRLSPHEMTFDPVFEAQDMALEGRSRLLASRKSLDACAEDVIDSEAFAEIEDRRACSSVYCGQGECAVVKGPQGACVCGLGEVARQYTELDGASAVTCIPAQSIVDFGLDGPVKDACVGIDCGAGECVDVGGFATCRCDEGQAARVDAETANPRCVAIEQPTGSPGAEDFSQPLEGLEVCDPLPPTCEDGGWLTPVVGQDVSGVECPDRVPDPERLEVTPEPEALECDDDSETDGEDPPQAEGDRNPGCGCSTSTQGSAWFLGLVGILGFCAPQLRRRRS